MENLRKFFNESKTILTTKPRGQHVFLCESKIRSIKRRLFYMCRQNKTENWPKYLSKVTLLVNNAQNPGIANMRPAQVDDDPDADIIVDEERKAVGNPLPSMNTMRVQQDLQDKFKNNSSMKNFQVGCYVLLDLPFDGITREKESVAKVSKSCR